MKEIIGKPKLKIKLEKYGMKHQYIDWVKSYLNSWKQHVCYSEGIWMISLIFVYHFF